MLRQNLSPIRAHALRSVRLAVALAPLLWLLLAPAAAQENPNPEQTRRMLDDALRDAKASQERKVQLMADNEKLTEQVAALQKQIAEMQGRMDELKRTDAEHAEQTFFLRSHYAAWQAFVGQNPELLAKWKVFLGAGLLHAPRALPEGVEPIWPDIAEDD